MSEYPGGRPSLPRPPNLPYGQRRYVTPTNVRVARDPHEPNVTRALPPFCPQNSIPSPICRIVAKRKPRKCLLLRGFHLARATGLEPATTESTVRQLHICSGPRNARFYGVFEPFPMPFRVLDILQFIVFSFRFPAVLGRSRTEFDGLRPLRYAPFS